MSFWRLAQAAPERAILTAEKRLTAGKLLAESNRLVHGLRARGLQPGDTVATILANEVAMIEVALATAQAGFYLTPINPNLTAREVEYITTDCEAKVVIRSAADAEALKSSDASTPADRRCGLVMNYTSGTTGRPKGVRRPLPPPQFSPDDLAARYAMFLRLFGIPAGTPSGGGVHLVVSPLYHTAVLSFCMNHLHNGDAIVLMDKWSPEGMLAAVERERVTSAHLVPTHFNRLLQLPEEVRKRHDLSSLRHIIHSAAPCPVDTKRRMLEWWGPVIYEYYAASEGGGTLVTPSEWVRKPGTVGKPWPTAEIRVLDDEGQPCTAGQVGTVYIKMADYRFEYFKDKNKTDSAWKDGFFTVGDAGYLDSEGYLFLCDRKADMIISGGVNVYPAEIESALIEHDKVRDVAVFGIPDDEWGESVKAVVELRPGATPSAELAEELRAFCVERLAKHKVPRSFDFTDALPRDPSGKLYKRRLRAPYWSGRARNI